MAKSSPLDIQYYRDDGLLFWIYVLCTSREGKNLPLKGKEVRTLPKEIAGAVQKDPDLHDTVLKALEKGGVWFCKVEGKGWRPRQRGGAKEVEAVQVVLDWLQRFETQGTVDGSRLIYAIIETSTSVK